MLYSIKLKCGTEYPLTGFEQAGVSYVPCGQVDGKDQPLFSFAHLWGERRQVTLESFGRKVFGYRRMSQMTGVQIMTGYPTFRYTERQGYFLYLNDIDIEYRLIEQYPEHYQRIREVYRNAVEGIPCEIETKSGGRRLSAYTLYGGPKMAFQDPDAAKDEKSMLLEIFSLKGLSRIDHRYAQISGSLLDIPVLPKDALIKIHGIISEVGTQKIEDRERRVVVGKSQIRDLDIEWNSNNLSQLFPTIHCQETSHQSNRDEVRFKRYPNLLSATGEPCVDGICFNCGGWWWEIPPAPGQRRSAPIRLSVSEYERETRSIEELRAELKADLAKWIETTENSDTQELLNVTYAAGVGKTTISVESIEYILYIAPTKDLADQAFSIADNLERDCWRHRPRMHNRDHENWEQLPLGLAANQRPCVHPETGNNLAMRGYDPVPNFCVERCEHHAECREKAFLAQLEIERNKQSVFIAFDECYFSDVRFESRVKHIIGNGKILVCDEPTPDGLTQQREIDTQELMSTFNNWRLQDDNSIDVAFILKTLLEDLSTADKPEQIRSAIAKSIQPLNDEDINTLDDALSKIPVGVVWQRDMLTDLFATVVFGDEERRVALSDDRSPPEGFDGTIPTFFVDEEKGVEVDKFKTLKVTLDTIDRMGFIDINTDALKAPRRYVNLIRDLRTFIDSGSKACLRVDGTIEFTLPPGLNAPRGITLTASDLDDLIGIIYEGTGINVTTLQAPPPPFMPGNKLFQIATGRYTPASGLFRENKDDDTNPFLSPFMRRTLTTILRIADQKLTLIVGPKALEQLIEKHHAEDMLLHQLYMHPNIEVINHYHAEGGNSYQDYEVGFFFHFEPSVSEFEKIASQVLYNYSPSFERVETDVVKDGITLKNVMRYKDERVQQVFDRECERRKMQALNRLRPMILPDKLMFLLSAEPISRIPIAPIPFTLSQLEKFILKEGGDVEAFDEYLAKLEDRSPKEVQQQDGVSQSWAYEVKKEKLQNDKAAAKAEAYRLHTEENLSYREIAQRLKENGMTKKLKSPRGIGYWIDSFKTDSVSSEKETERGRRAKLRDEKAAVKAEAFRLHIDEGLSYREIAQQLKERGMTDKVKGPRTIGYWIQQFKDQQGVQKTRICAKIPVSDINI